MFACLYVISILLLTTTIVESSITIIHRRALHQPFFPIDSVPPPPVITQPPPPHTPSRYHYHKPKPKPKPKTKSKQLGPKYPFSSQSPPPAKGNDLFFPSYSSPPSPPSPPSAHSSSSSSSKSLPTFPANITSMGDLPQSSPSKPNSHKLADIAITVSLVSAASIALIAASLLYYHRRHLKHIHPKPIRSHSLRLCDTAASDKPPHVQLLPLRPRNPSGSSAEFLNLGTLADPPRIADQNNSLNNVAGSSSVMGYQKLGSPELHPLPPLPRRDYRRNSRVGFLEDYEEDNDAEFFSPEASSNGTLSPNGNNNIVNYRRMSQTLQSLNSGNRRSSNSKTPSDSASPTSPSSSKSNWLDSVVHFRPPPRPEVKSPSSLPSPGSSLWDTHSSPARAINFSRQQQYEPVKMPPPPPPPLPPMDYWEAASLPTPASSRDPVNGPPPMPESPTTKSIAAENLEEIQKPKLKSLYWDKVKASSNTTMVWDQMKSSTSFQLNEEMMETLFVINSSKSTAKDFSNLQINNENRVLDPKKSQNIAILLRALNVTIDEVCEGLLEGNIDNLGTDLLESLSKMAPTKEEECKLIEFNDVSKLGPAEKFLKALLDVPFAFKRVDALLYIANFDSEVDYLKRSFETLEAACDELRNSKMFLKLLEAVLKTGNRLNVGTNRGDAHAFKLDTLLKLADIKGTDGRTTLLHFVVQEIIRTEGHSRLSVPNLNPTSEIEINQQSELRDDVELRKIGLQVVFSLSGELSNVKKAASMNSNMLYSEIGKLATGIAKIGEVFRLNEEINRQTDSKKFRDSMNGFLKKAKNSIIKIQAQESAALSMVKEITEYFHGNSIKEEAHPFRIFMVVGDFLSVLDQVCRDVGKVNERTVVNLARPFQMS